MGELEQRVALGKSRIGEQLAQKTELALAEAELEHQRGLRRVAYEMLSFLTGLDPHPVIRLHDPATMGSDSLERYLSAAAVRPDVEAAGAAADLAQRNIRVHANVDELGNAPSGGGDLAVSLSDFSIRNSVFARMLFAALVLFGGIAFRELGVSEMPDVDFPVVNEKQIRLVRGALT